MLTVEKKAASAALVALFYIALWQVASMLIEQRLLVPSPLVVLRELVGLSASLSYWQSVAMSLARVLLGYAAGLALGVLLAVLCHAAGFLRALVRPMMGVIRATPVASFIIITLYFMKVGDVPGFTSFLMVLPVVFGNVLEGLDQTDPKLLEMAKVFHLPRRSIALNIHLPAAVPYAVTAAITSLGLAWKAGIAAEVLGSPALSIGRVLRDSKLTLNTPALFAWTLVVIALSLLLETLLRRALGGASRRLGAVGIERTQREGRA